MHCEQGPYRTRHEPVILRIQPFSVLCVLLVDGMAAREEEANGEQTQIRLDSESYVQCDERVSSIQSWLLMFPLP